MILQAEGKFDPKTSTFKVSVDLQGHTEFEHELLAAFFDQERTLSARPVHRGDELFVDFILSDTSAFDRARHNLENRKRKADGKPTIEEEAKAKADAEAAAEKAKIDAAAAEQKAAEDKAKSDDAFAQRIADAIKGKTEPPKPSGPIQ